MPQSCYTISQQFNFFRQSWPCRTTRRSRVTATTSWTRCDCGRPWRRATSTSASLTMATTSKPFSRRILLRTSRKFSIPTTIISEEKSSGWSRSTSSAQQRSKTCLGGDLSLLNLSSSYSKFVLVSWRKTNLSCQLWLDMKLNLNFTFFRYKHSKFGVMEVTRKDFTHMPDKVCVQPKTASQNELYNTLISVLSKCFI